MNLKTKIIIDDNIKDVKSKSNTKKIINKLQNLESYNDNNIISPQEISELQGTLIELNNDKYDEKTKSSAIDLRTRLHNSEISSILCIDILTGLNFLPVEIYPLTLNKKRLNVSKDGRGRSEIVEIAQGKREQDIQASFGSRIKNLFNGDKGGL